MANVSLPGVVRHLRERVAVHHETCRTDCELLQCFVAEKDQTAFAELLRRHSRLVQGVCQRVLGSPHDADDAFQATFLVLARKASTIRNGTTLASWLYGVSYRVAMRAKRDAARRRKHEQNTTRENRTPTPPDWETGWRELQAVLDEEVQKLAPTFREAFVLCCLEGLAKHEAAKQIGIKEGTLSSRLARARQRLQKQLAQRGIHLSAVLSALALASNTTARVSRTLLEATATAATQYGTGSPVTVSGFSATALKLAEGAIQTMGTTKMKLVLALLMTLGILGFGASLLAYPEPPTNEPAALPKPSEPAPKKATPPNRLADRDGQPVKSVEVTGTVLGPASQPVLNAKVAVYAFRTKVGEATTGKDGSYRLDLPSDKLTRELRIVARADGLGLDWQYLTTKEKKPITLRLPIDDLGIEGRVLDLEGRPVPDATVAVNRIGVFRKPTDPDAWVKRYQASYRATNEFRDAGTTTLGCYAKVKVDSEGRFRLIGFGRSRLVHLEILGPNVEYTIAQVFVHPGPKRGWKPGRWGVYPAKFDVVLGPSKPIVGTVRDSKTKKPIPGIRVMAGPSNQRMSKTDENGTFRIDGISKSEEYWLSAGGEIGVPYFDRTRHHIPDTPGVEPLRVDMVLERGVQITGKVIDTVTGKPVKGRVGWHATTDNPNLRDFSSLSGARMIVSNFGKLQPDGTFTVLGIPGSGAISVTAEPRGNYTQHIPADLKLGGLVMEFSHTYLPVDVDPSKPESLTCIAKLQPGRILSGELLDPSGKLLDGVRAAGLSPTVTYTGFEEPLSQAEFSIVGLDQRKRKVLFAHPKRKLAKLVTVNADTTEPLKVTLQEPTGVVRGRIVTGEKHTPRPNLKVTAVLTRKYELYGKEFPLDLLIDSRTWDPILQVETKTDEKGCFELKGLVPGLKYWIYWENRGMLYGGESEAVAVSADKTIDVGDLSTTKSPNEEGKDTP